MQYAVYLRKICTPCNSHHAPPAKAPGLFPFAGVVCIATLRYSTHGQCMLPQTDDKPRKAGFCKGTPAPGLYGASELRLPLAAEH